MRTRRLGVMAAAAAVGLLTAITPPSPAAQKRAPKPAPLQFATHPVAADSDFGEPSIDVSPQGYVFVVAPGGAGVQMWRSFDQGRTFDHKEIAAPNGGGDSEIEFLRNGTGLTADLEILDSAVSRSTDNFETFDQSQVGIEQDRQWLGHWCSDLAVLAYHDFVLEAELLQRSTDGGKTWDPLPVAVSPNGGAPGTQGGDDDVDVLPDQGVNTFSGPVVVQGKDVYVTYAISTAEGNLLTGTPPYGDPEQIVVGVSHDAGQTFQTQIVKRGGVGMLAGVIFPWITTDAAGNVYVSYAGRDRRDDPIDTWLVASTDHGEHWGAPVRVNRDHGPAHIYTTVSAGDPGVVNMAWYTSTTPDPGSADNDWYVDFAQIRDAASATPKVNQVRVTPTPIHHGDICLNGILCETGGDRSLLDFFQVQTGPDGVANIAYAANYDPKAADKHAEHNTVWYARQTGGPLAGNGRRDLDKGACPA